MKTDQNKTTMVYINFPAALTEEEEILKLKYAKLRKKADLAANIADEDWLDTEKIIRGKIDQHSVAKRAVDRCYTRLIEDLAPNYILDRLTEKGCIPFVQIRDIRETRLTSGKNRGLCDAVKRDPSRYVAFKEALVETRQTNLAQHLAATEQMIHDELKGLGFKCDCSPTKECDLLKGLAGNPRGNVPLAPSKAVKELRERLIQLYTERYLHLPINPFTLELTEPLSKLYVAPSMQIREFSPLSSIRSSDVKGTRVNTIADVLAPTAKKIYLIGEACSGKTTFCRHIVQTWCNLHQERHQSRSDVENEETTLANFDLLFYIPLENYNMFGDIESMIKETVRSDVAELLDEQRCLIILDGLDKWSQPRDYKRPLLVTKGLPNRAIANRYTVLTTVRPWKLADIKPKSTDIDLLVNIEGLDTNKGHELASKILSVLGASEPAQTEPFFTAMNNAGLQSYIRIPAILCHCVCLWFSKRTLGNSLLESTASLLEICLGTVNKEGDRKAIGNETAESKEDGDSARQYDKRAHRRQQEPFYCPPCFRKEHCQLYWSEILSLSDTAYKFLFNTRTDEAVSYKHTLSQETRRIAIEAGILSESNVYDNALERTTEISFVNKPFEEALAALYISNNGMVAIEEMFNAYSTASRILDVANTMLFLCGLQGELSDNLNRRLMVTVDQDMQVRQYRESAVRRSTGLIQNMQNLILSCVAEASSLKGDSSYRPVLIHDIVIDQATEQALGRLYDKELGKRLGLIVRTEVIKSASITTDALSKDRHTRDHLMMLFRGVEESRQLQKVHIDDSGHVFPVLDVYGLICQSYPSLRALYLEWINLAELGARFSVVLDKLELRSLCLRHSKLSHSQLNSLHGELAGLEELDLTEISCVDCPLQQCRYPLKLDYKVLLKSLKLSGLDVEDVRFTARALETLETGRLRGGAERTIFNNTHDDNKITHLTCSECIDIASLSALLEHLPNLVFLKISRTDLGKIGLSLPSTLLNLELVQLEFVTMSRRAAADFVESIYSLGHVVHVELFAVTSLHDLLLITYHLRNSPSKFCITKDTAKEIWFDTIHGK